MVFKEIFFGILIVCWFLYIDVKWKEIVILVLFDGFWWDYFDMNWMNMDYFNFIVKDGVWVEYVRNVFLMVIFFNYYMIVIGFYFESYGIILNFMYDLVVNVLFIMWMNDLKWWNKFVEFFWVIIEK